MRELQPDRPEQADETAKHYEARQLAKLTGFLYEILHGEASSKDVADWALDDLSDYCVGVTKRDPEMGQILVDTLESADTGESISHAVAVHNQQISDRLREELGLPARDPPDQAQPDAERATALPS